MGKKISVRSAKGSMILKKSDKLVALKTKNEAFAIEEGSIKEVAKRHLGGFEVVKMQVSGEEAVDKNLNRLRQKDDVEVGSHIYHVEGSDKPVVPTGEIYIVFHPNTDEEEQLIVLDEYKLEMVERRDADRIIAKVTPRSMNPLKTAAAMEEYPLVKMAEPDIDVPLDDYAFFEPEDALYEHQWHLQNPGFVVDFDKRMKKGADTKVVDAWKRLDGFGAKDITVAIVDNGFDIHHPDLADKVYKPWDFWYGRSELYQDDPSFTHGTPCASVAVAGLNGTGIVGAAPNARFMPLNGTSFSLRATEQIFDYCIENGADVVSCSWGSTNPNFDLNALKKEAISKAAREGRNGKGCVICFAVGNDGYDYVSFYSAHPDVIAVGACDSNDLHSSYSNQGMEIDVVASSNGDWPITAARASWDNGISSRTGSFKYWADGQNRSGFHKHFGGTSSACPLVAGICALVLSANPKLTAKEVKDIICKTADKIGSPSDYDHKGHSKKYGYGRVNADRAVAEALRLRDGGGVVTPPKTVENEIKKGSGIFRFSVEKQPAKGFGVQVGVYAKYGNVLIATETLQSRLSFPIIVSINELQGRTVYKVIVGAFDTREEAANLSAQLKRLSVNGFVRDFRDLVEYEK